jgi:alkanesulfonate monooxygenase SsuD/methylene tetrahydromethanopterin reductase-like flavin-dependent oxidoreductase (luciferase family)
MFGYCKLDELLLKPESNERRTRNPTDTTRLKDRLDYYTWLAKTVEKGKITLIFSADTYGVHETYGRNADAAFKGGAWVAILDTVILISAMAQVTKSASFAVTGSTSYLSESKTIVCYAKN